ncbi:MAG: tryptophan 2,3-dioxygenase family protein [Acidobacteriota bacterium]|nr:tryptophan 2,3-dioxygenase family protein [Acidobacteriota bacterium]
MSLTYGEYLKLEQLLELQRPLSSDPEEHDETLFIIIHQVYELWFKQVLHELEWLQGALEADDVPRISATFKRILTIFKTLVAQVDVLETMTPVSFLSFRSRIDNASGFQSAQFREMEFLLGHRRKGMMRHYEEEQGEQSRLQQALEGRSLWQSFLRYLRHHDYEIPTELADGVQETSTEPSPEVQRELIRAYRHDDAVREVCERMVDLDEGLQEWRYRHVKMVERTIGFKRGTGGSSGADYLRTTIFQPLFPDLWAIRTDL